MSLTSLGWRPFFADAFATLDRPDLTPARVLRPDRQQALLHTGTDTRRALLLGAMLQAPPAERPAVGDWVAVQLFDDQAILHAVLPRFGAFSRKTPGQTTREQVLAANVDVAFLLSGLDHDFNLRRIERYLVQTASSGATPVLLLNKADACPDVPERVAAVQKIAPGVPVWPISAAAGTGLDQLDAYLQPGQTAVFLGSSGVGKSTLLNRLLGVEQQATGAVRADDSRGRHTTTHRELFLLPTGGLVIDTPGLRELQLWANPDDLGTAFPDIEALATGCRFTDCTHTVEPGCAVLAAVEAGSLDEKRLASYQKLRRELAYLERRQGEAAPYAERQRQRAQGRLYKSIQQNNRKRK